MSIHIIFPIIYLCVCVNLVQLSAGIDLVDV